MARKGLSQILFLIIAASVLMMAALTLIFAFNQGIGGGTSDVSDSACDTAIRSQCSVAGSGETISVPANCPSDISSSELPQGVNLGEDEGTLAC
ncbi:MAG: hypothetical protein ACI977_000040 [Candidatus Nanohaloarchaea archaeon]|jgi:hypothetical protein